MLTISGIKKCRQHVVIYQDNYDKTLMNQNCSNNPHSHHCTVALLSSSGHSLSSSLLPVQKLFAPISVELSHILFLNQRSWLPFTYIRLQLMRSLAPFPQFPDISRQNMLLKELLNQNNNLIQRNIAHVVAYDCSPFIKKQFL